MFVCVGGGASGHDSLTNLVAPLSWGRNDRRPEQLNHGSYHEVVLMKVTAFVILIHGRCSTARVHGQEMSKELVIARCAIGLANDNGDLSKVKHLPDDSMRP